MNKKALLLIIPFAAAGLAGCERANPNPPGPTPDPQCESATVNIKSAGDVTTIKPTATLQLTAEVNISGCTFSWSSSDPTIATVDANGLVTGVKAGDVVIHYGTGSFNLKVDDDAPTPPVVSGLKEAYEAGFAKTSGATDPMTFSATVVAIRSCSGEYFIQDGEYGIDLYHPAEADVPKLVIGKKVKVTAALCNYKGLVETSGDIKVEADGDGVVPQPANVASKAALDALKTNVLANAEGVVVKKEVNTKNNDTTLTIAIAGENVPVFFKGGIINDYTTFLNAATEGVTVVLNKVIVGDRDGRQLIVVDGSELTAGEPTPTKEVKTLAIAGTATKTTYNEGEAYSAAGLSVVATYTDDTTGTVTVAITPSKAKAELGDTSVTFSATFGGKTATKDVDVTVSEKPSPVGECASYTFKNDKTSSQNMGTWTSEQFMNLVEVDGDEVITGMKDVTNAYIGGNGGSGDTTWELWDCLKVGKSNAQGTITLNLDTSATFTSIKLDVIGNRDDGELTINGITKDVTKKAIKGDLETVELEYDIAGGVDKLVISSKDAKSGNYGICITRIGFVGGLPITPSVEKVELDKTTLNLQPEGSEKLTATVKVKGSADKTVTWSSDNEAVATVDTNGTVHAVAVGTAHITATSTVDSSKSAFCTVNVKLPRVVSTVTIKDWPKEITAGQTISASQVKVDVEYNEGDPDTNINPDSVKLTTIDAENASLVATVNGVDSAAVSVSIAAAEDLTPVELTTTEGVSASEATVNEIAAIKCGTGSAKGSMKMTLPKGTTKLVFYAVGWKDTTTKITVSGLGADKEIDLDSNAGLTGNSPFTLVDANPSDFRVEINLDSALTIQTKVTVAATTGNRFALWNAGVKIETRTVQSVTVVGYPENIYVDDNITKEDITVNVTYDKGDQDTGVHPDSFTLDTSVAGTANLVATVGGVNSEPIAVTILPQRTISTVTIVDYPHSISEGETITVDDVLVDVVYSVGDPDEDIHPNSILLGTPVGGKANLTATYGTVTSAAVEVTVNKADAITPISVKDTGTGDASNAVVIVDGVENDAVKLDNRTSNSKTSGMSFEVPAGSRKLILNAGAWKDKAASITISGFGVNASTFDLTSDSGISNNSPFTLSTTDLTNFKKVITLDNALTSATTITISGTGDRCLVWGAGVVVDDREISKVEIVNYPDAIYVDDVINADNVLIDVTYKSGNPDEGIHPDTATLDTTSEGTKELIVTFKGVEAKANVEVLAKRTITKVEIVDYPDTIKSDETITKDQVKVDVTFNTGNSLEGIEPDSIATTTPSENKFNLTATYGGVTSEAVQVSISTEKSYTAIELSNVNYTVDISADEKYDAVKCGSTKAGGSMSFVVPQGTTELVFYIGSWKGDATTVTVEGIEELTSIKLAEDEAFTGTATEVTLNEDMDTFKQTVKFTKALEKDTTITIKTSAGKSRFIVWNAAYAK